MAGTVALGPMEKPFSHEQVARSLERPLGEVEAGGAHGSVVQHEGLARDVPVRLDEGGEEPPGLLGIGLPLRRSRVWRDMAKVLLFGPHRLFSRRFRHAQEARPTISASGKVSGFAKSRQTTRRR